MKSMDFGCAALHGADEHVTLCAPLQQLKQEHQPLMEQMKTCHALADELLAEEVSARPQLFGKLREEVADFTDKLKKHSRKEDDGLFPMMARYIGSTSGPIAVMEYEHEIAEQHLQRFLEQSEKLTGMEDEVVQPVVQEAVQAHLILERHFSKEERVLFPMAENMLSPEEKDELDRMIQQM